MSGPGRFGEPHRGLEQRLCVVEVAAVDIDLRDVRVEHRGVGETATSPSTLRRLLVQIDRAVPIPGEVRADTWEALAASCERLKQYREAAAAYFRCFQADPSPRRQSVLNDLVRLQNFQVIGKREIQELIRLTGGGSFSSFYRVLLADALIHALFFDSFHP